jgi:hypothetical protein
VCGVSIDFDHGMVGEQKQKTKNALMMMMMMMRRRS